MLLLGAGEMGKETLRYLRAEGACEIVCAQPSPAACRSRSPSPSTLPWTTGNSYARHRLGRPDCQHDRCAKTVVTADRFRGIHSSGSERLLFVLDLAVPRDFDPAIAQFTNVYLYCLDDLHAVCEANRKAAKKNGPKRNGSSTKNNAAFWPSGIIG